MKGKSMVELDTYLSVDIVGITLLRESRRHAQKLKRNTGEVKTNFASQRNKATHKAVEKLFKFNK